MTFQISALPIDPFTPLFALDDAALAERQARRVIAETALGYPCRVSLRHAAPGEHVILAHYQHQDADTPFRASHAVFVRENAVPPHLAVDEIPADFAIRPFSLRGFDAEGMLIAADLAEGEAALAEEIATIFADPAVAYIHLHYARHGCYAARVDRG